MRILSLIRAEAPRNLKAMALMSALSAVSIATMLWVVGSAAQATTQGPPSFRLLVMFVLSVTLFAVTHVYVADTAARDIEAIIDRLRARLFDDIRRSDLTTVETIGRAALQDALVSDTQILARTLPMLVIGAQQGALLLFLGIYLVILSPMASLLALGFAAATLAIRLTRMRALSVATRAAKASERRVFDGLTDLLRGFKEVRMSRARADDLLAGVTCDSAESAATNSATKARWGWEFAVLQTLFYALVGLMVFVAPLLAKDYWQVVVPATIAALFMVGPLGTVAQVAPLVGETELALAHIADLRASLRPEHADLPSAAGAPAPQDIGLRDAVFSYRDAEGCTIFTVGPLSVCFPAGTIVFVTGGNGSGKSTLLKLLTGLLPLAAGDLLLDGRPVDPSERQAYRDLISTVFSDYHLSRRLHGVPRPDPGHVRHWLDRLRMTGKTQLEDGVFSTIDLSTGQRKRLAFLVAELEQKPIVVLDELAADQDGEMRRLFYEQILPELKARGKIVICATHDERWFHLADRIYHMDEGRLHETTASS
jgi:putative ATP-binding cassette transporter